MSSKDRKHTNRDQSGKHKPSAHGDRESYFERDKKRSEKKESQDKIKSDSGARDRDAGRGDRTDHRTKGLSGEERTRDKRDREEKRREKTKEEPQNERRTHKSDQEHEEERRRRHEEKRRRRKEETNVSEEKRKPKIDVYDEHERVKRKSEISVDRNGKEKYEIAVKDPEKRMHRSEKDEHQRKKREKDVNFETEKQEEREKEGQSRRKHQQKELEKNPDLKPNNRHEERKKSVVEEYDIDYDDDFENFEEEKIEEEKEDEEEERQESSASIERVNNNLEAVKESSSVSGSSRDSFLKDNHNRSLQKPQPTPIGQIQSSFINFRIAQKKRSHNLVANKMLDRAFDLSRLIDLDRVHFDIFDISPIRKHSQYMQLFGKEGCQHEGCQTGDDNIARESQTEVIEYRIVWTQYPTSDESESCQIVYDSSGTQTLLQPSNSVDTTSLELLNESNNYVSLSKILSLMEAVLEEEACFEIKTKVSVTGNEKNAISIGYSQYDNDEKAICLMGRFAWSNSNMFVTVHQVAKPSKPKEQERRVISPVSVWKVSANTDEPYIYLTSLKTDENQSSISCITFSLDPAASHVICGLNSGAIALWDLREYSYNTHYEKGLLPAYFTSASIEDAESFHKGPIVALQPISTGVSLNSYKLISVDSFTQLFIWLVSAVTQRDQWSLASGSLTDFNLRPGARYRISKLASMPLTSHALGIPDYYVTSMTVDSSSNYNLFLGTNSGQIIQYARANQKVFHTSNSNSHHKILGEADLFQLGAVTQLDFYPFFEPYLLAGYDDGLIHLFTVGKAKPLLSFIYKQNVPILQLKWSRSHPAIFFSLSADGSLCVWNVLQDIYKPIFVQKFINYIGFDLSSDSQWQIKDKNSRNNKARLLLWALDGRVEVHELSDIYSNPELDDGFKTCSLFQTLI